ERNGCDPLYSTDCHRRDSDNCRLSRSAARYWGSEAGSIESQIVSIVIEAIGRRLGLAVVGGGPGSAIGETHRIAARLDGYYDIVASALSSDPERSRLSGRAIGVSEDRAYKSWQTLIEGETGRPDRADVIAVMTPNDSHYEICSKALDA